MLYIYPVDPNLFDSRATNSVLERFVWGIQCISSAGSIMCTVIIGRMRGSVVSRTHNISTNSIGGICIFRSQFFFLRHICSRHDDAVGANTGQTRISSSCGVEQTDLKMVYEILKFWILFVKLILFLFPGVDTRIDESQTLEKSKQWRTGLAKEECSFKNCNI